VLDPPDYGLCARRLLRWAMTLVAVNWSAIKRTADELQRKGTLFDADVRRILDEVRRSPGLKGRQPP
jgi:hypothetical protein